MKAKIIHYAKEIVIFLIIMTILANVISYYKSGDLNKTQFSLTDIPLMDGSLHNIDKDKALLVHFWATWCPTCKAEASNINSIDEHYQVITIAVKSGSADDITKFKNDNNLNFKIVNDTKGVEAQQFNVMAYPTTFIYDRDQNLVFSDVGYTTTWGLWLRMWWASL